MRVRLAQKGIGLGEFAELQFHFAVADPLVARLVQPKISFMREGGRLQQRPRCRPF